MIINHYLELAYKYSDYTDKIKYQGDYANGHTYPIIYDKLFSQYKNRDVNFLEIGLNFGGNVALVCDYFDLERNGYRTAKNFIITLKG